MFLPVCGGGGGGGGCGGGGATFRLHQNIDKSVAVSYFTDVSLYTFLFGLPVSLTSGAIFDFFKTVFAGEFRLVAVVRLLDLSPDDDDDDEVMLNVLRCQLTY